MIKSSLRSTHVKSKLFKNGTKWCRNNIFWSLRRGHNHLWTIIKKNQAPPPQFFFLIIHPFIHRQVMSLVVIHSIYQFVHLKGELNNIKIILLYRNDNVFKSWRIHMINGGVLLIKQSKRRSLSLKIALRTERGLLLLLFEFFTCISCSR